MVRINVVVEGETEEAFVKRVLIPEFNHYNIFFYPRLTVTNRQLGRKGKGGFNPRTGYQTNIRKEIVRCLNDQSAYCTTLLDLYGLPNDFPGISTLNPDLETKVDTLFRELENDINNPRFIPNLMVHEFEGYLFTEPQIIARELEATPSQTRQLEQIRSDFDSPEKINDGPQTAPSKRIESIFPHYKKTYHGPLISQEISLVRMKNECYYLNKWLEKLQHLQELPT